MSVSRDRANVASLARMLGGRPPAEVSQPLVSTAIGAGGGGGGGGLSAWVFIESAPGVTLTIGAPYYYAAGGWTPLSSSIVGRRTVGVCIAASSDPAGSTLLIAGEFARSGTAGVRLFASPSGSITETFPGNQADETAGAPWVWSIGWQISSTRAVILPCDPYRPRLVTYCLTDGSTQAAIVVRESPADTDV